MVCLPLYDACASPPARGCFLGFGRIPGSRSWNIRCAIPCPGAGVAPFRARCSLGATHCLPAVGPLTGSLRGHRPLRVCLKIHQSAASNALRLGRSLVRHTKNKLVEVHIFTHLTVTFPSGELSAMRYTPGGSAAAPAGRGHTDKPCGTLIAQRISDCPDTSCRLTSI